MMKLKSSPFSDKFPDRDISQELAIMSKAIVKNGVTVEDVLSSNVTVHLWVQNRFGLEAMVVTSSDGVMNYVAVVYRGSNAFEEAITNLTVGLTPFGYGLNRSIKIHKGVKTACHGENASVAVEKKVLELLANPRLKLSGDVFISGHSLGGRNFIKSHHMLVIPVH